MNIVKWYITSKVYFLLPEGHAPIDTIKVDMEFNIQRCATAYIFNEIKFHLF